MRARSAIAALAGLLVIGALAIGAPRILPFLSAGRGRPALSRQG